MNKIIIVLLICLCTCFSAFCEEFRVDYNEDSDQPYCLFFNTLDDAPGTVELVRSDRPPFSPPIDLLEIPSTVAYNGMDYTVTTIRAYFAYIKNLIVPHTVRWIKDYMGDINYLETVVFDNSPIEELYAWGIFADCANLKYVDFGASCIFKDLPYQTFRNCTSLEEVNLPESIENIGQEAFMGCSTLKHITIPSKVRNIYRVFVNCTSLENVEFAGDELGWISEAFMNCVSLKDITLPAPVGTSYSAFANCTGLQRVTIKSKSNSEFQIWDFAFDNCINLKEIKYVPSALKYIGAGAFNKCASLSEISLDSECYIGDKAFGGCISLEKFKVIGSGGSLSSIQGVLIQDGSKLIAYPQGKKDSDYTIPSTITKISNGAFEGATNLVNVTIGNNVKEMGVMAFRDCKALRNVELPNNLKYLPSGTFMDCTSLEEIALPDTYIYLGKESFKGCSSLPSVKLPENLKVLGEGVFSNCSKIEEIIIPDGVAEIRASTFRNCESLKNIQLPTQLDTIHFAAMQGCKSLQAISLPTTLRGIGERVFKGCESLQTIVVPDNVSEIGYNTFEECTSLKDVTIGNGVKGIGNWAFYNCAELETLVLGSGLETIGTEAFDGDVNIRDITCLSVNPPSFPSGFPKEVVAHAIVTVPEGSEDLYNSIPEWAPMVEGEDISVDEIFNDIDNEFFIDGNIIVTTVPVEVYNFSGSLITRVNGSSTLPKGMYILRTSRCSRRVVIK